MTGRDCGRVFSWAKRRDFEPRAIRWWSSGAAPEQNRRVIFDVVQQLKEKGSPGVTGEGAGVVGEGGKQEKEEDRMECSQVRSAPCRRLVVAVGGSLGKAWFP